MLVKICGLMNKQDVTAAVDSGADYLGFVFADSKRRVTPEHAARISTGVPEHVLKVGVFVNPTKEEVEETVRVAKLDLIQLHGEESPKFCQAMQKPVIKAFSIRSDSDINQFKAYDVKHILTDAPGGKYRGGSGHTFDWTVLKGGSAEIFLAGGLTPENVSAAIRETSPIGVDVSSGVETDGKKDHSKIHAFIKEAKRSY
ncbi:phosphoribosylanthranilate isomerase [Jeotgalibacillus alimentarius]|uniref:N-(5'-phosphoribosyl)anthranilate isomerase n=1 Tax=Jeotgalibacillus alimentarius TaxID=135826 RepID=A0A0C2RF50_9BACL|nr:phosphoribosylanthranilate isomerase [Jeotgalibacillus alimentarius]KIL48825.1 phosphoribosylanthranilate isomerase [Jeotgalibacillus alimentarius]